jgi:hypothetical protein
MIGLIVPRAILVNMLTSLNASVVTVSKCGNTKIIFLQSLGFNIWVSLCGSAVEVVGMRK